jgi:pyruvate kinase
VNSFFLAVNAAMVNGANAIIVLTDSGKTVKMISKFRPECPIIAVTRKAGVARQCLLLRGAFPILLPGKFSFKQSN